MTVPTLATFDVNKSSDRQRFLQFIKTDVRRRLQDPDHSFVFGSASVGRLLPQQSNPADADLVDLDIRAGDSGITLRLRTDNLYVVGFRNGEGTWFEFAHDHAGGPMIRVDGTNDRRQDLGFSGSYTGEGLGSLDSIIGRENILGVNAVQQAVINLAEYTGENHTDGEVKRWLRSLIVNFIESTRFDTLAERVHDLMTNPPPAGDEREKLLKLTPELAALLRRWGSLSDALVLAANYPTAQDFTSFHGVGVHNAYTAATTLGIVLISLSLSSSARSLVVHDDDGSDDRQLQEAAADAVGLTLVEVMGVVINNIDRENPGDLYGTIRITDGFGTATLFNRGDHDSQSVGPGGWADLTWPTRALSGADDFVIDVHLMDYDGIGPNDQVADGQVAWNSRDTVGGDYDTLRRKRVDGKYGSVEVQYAVLTQAVVAAVRVVMVDGDGEAKPDVYGTVTATTRMSSGELLEYKLFNRSRANDIGVEKGADVPLSRKVISAALGSRLEIDANLWDRDRDLSPDDQIAQGSATFQPQLKGSASQEISGEYGKVKVQVTWSTSFEHV